MAAVSFVDSILQKCCVITHFKQLQAHLIISGLFHQYSPFRRKLLEFLALSSAANLDYATDLFLRLQNPSTNDWNALIRGLAQCDEPKRALLCYLSMSRCPQKPDALTCSFALKACARILAISEGRQLHAQALRIGFEADVMLQTTLMDLYAKGGDLNSAQQLFDEMPLKDVPAWNALIAGFAQGSQPKDALALFARMRSAGVKPNEVTVVGALSACSQIGALGEGKSIHSYAREVGLDTNIRVCNVLIDMYAKCGFVDGACEVFDKMPHRSLVSWNTIIMTLAMHGRASLAIELFEQMGSAGVKPDAITYVAALCACNHAGLVDAGLCIFNSMASSNVPRNIKHYGCAVDLLGRAGRLEEAYNLITSMPLPQDAVLWQSLLGACKTYGNVALAEHASHKLAEMGSKSCGDFVLLSNVYAAHERWDDVGRVREVMKSNAVKKIPGFSYIEAGGVMHKFVNGDQTHSNWKEIYSMLDEIGMKIKAFGYVPRIDFVLHDIGEEDKENALFYHSEKLAVAYGLVSTEEGTAIQVIKNLRICVDCHEVFKLVSKIYNREVIVRDRARFHRFIEGSCSCGDYW